MSNATDLFGVNGATPFEQMRREAKRQERGAPNALASGDGFAASVGVADGASDVGGYAGSSYVPVSLPDISAVTDLIVNGDWTLTSVAASAGGSVNLQSATEAEVNLTVTITPNVNAAADPAASVVINLIGILDEIPEFNGDGWEPVDDVPVSGTVAGSPFSGTITAATGEVAGLETVLADGDELVLAWVGAVAIPAP